MTVLVVAIVLVVAGEPAEESPNTAPPPSSGDQTQVLKLASRSKDVAEATPSPMLGEPVDVQFTQPANQSGEIAQRLQKTWAAAWQHSDKPQGLAYAMDTLVLARILHNEERMQDARDFIIAGYPTSIAAWSQVEEMGSAAAFRKFFTRIVRQHRPKTVNDSFYRRMEVVLFRGIAAYGQPALIDPNDLPHTLMVALVTQRCGAWDVYERAIDVLRNTEIVGPPSQTREARIAQQVAEVYFADPADGDNDPVTVATRLHDLEKSNDSDLFCALHFHSLTDADRARPEVQVIMLEQAHRESEFAKVTELAAAVRNQEPDSHHRLDVLEAWGHAAQRNYAAATARLDAVTVDGAKDHWAQVAGYLQPLIQAVPENATKTVAGLQQAASWLDQPNPSVDIVATIKPSQVATTGQSSVCWRIDFSYRWDQLLEAMIRRDDEVSLAISCTRDRVKLFVANHGTLVNKQTFALIPKLWVHNAPRPGEGSFNIHCNTGTWEESTAGFARLHADTPKLFQEVFLSGMARQGRLPLYCEAHDGLTRTDWIWLSAKPVNRSLAHGFPLADLRTDTAEWPFIEHFEAIRCETIPANDEVRMAGQGFEFSLRGVDGDAPSILPEWPAGPEEFVDSEKDAAVFWQMMGRLWSFAQEMMAGAAN